MNRITINFSPCSPAIGYHVFYREVGDVSFIEWPDIFTTSPIIFEVDGTTDQLYEGYIISECEGDILGPQVPFETVLCSELEGGCCDPEVIDAEAETIIPDGSGSGSESLGDSFFRLVFNVDMSGESISDWEVFFGQAFDSVIYSAGGTVVDIYTAGPVTFPAVIFENSTTLVRVLDGFFGVITNIEASAFRQCDSLIELDLPSVVTIGSAMCFTDSALTDVNLPLITIIKDASFAACENLINFNAPLTLTIEQSGLDFTGMSTVNFPNLLTIGVAGMRQMLNLTTLSLPNCTFIDEEGLRGYQVCTLINLPACTAVNLRCFRDCVGVQTINLPVCTDLGGTTGDDLVFENITGETITLTIPTATATDTDVTILQANNSVTLILV